MSLIACNQMPPLEAEPVLADDACASYIPFYAQQDSSATALRIECNCQDSLVDLSSKLVPYTQVANLSFNCDASQFNLIPKMPSVTHLTSEVMTGNILAFPNLEVFENKKLMQGPLVQQMLFLSHLREVILVNPTSIPTIIRTNPLEVF